MFYLFFHHEFAAPLHPSLVEESNPIALARVDSLLASTPTGLTFDAEERAGASGRHATLTKNERSRKKLAEAASDGIDCYVRVYAGPAVDLGTGCCGAARGRLHAARSGEDEVESGDNHSARTDSIIGDENNDHGRSPVWTSEQNNILTIVLGPHDECLTIEAWDSDIDADDYIGGASIQLREMVDGGAADLDGVADGLLHIQLVTQAIYT